MGSQGYVIVPLVCGVGDLPDLLATGASGSAGPSTGLEYSRETMKTKINIMSISKDSLHLL